MVKEADAGAARVPRRCRPAPAAARSSFSAVLRSISAARLMASSIVPTRASIDRAWSSKPSARAIEAPAAGQRGERRHRSCTSVNRRRNTAATAPTRSAPRRWSAARGWSRRRNPRTRCPTPDRRARSRHGNVGGERLGVGADSCQVLGRERLGDRERLRGVGDVHQPDDRPRRLAPVDPLRQRVEQPPESEIATTIVPGPCSAWASRSSATGSGSSVVAVGDHDQVRRTVEAIDRRHWPYTWRLASCTYRLPGPTTRRPARRSRSVAPARRSPGRHPSGRRPTRRPAGRRRGSPDRRRHRGRAASNGDLTHAGDVGDDGAHHDRTTDTGRGRRALDAGAVEAGTSRSTDLVPSNGRSGRRAAAPGRPWRRSRSPSSRPARSSRRAARRRYRARLRDAQRRRRGAVGVELTRVVAQRVVAGGADPAR